MLQESVDLVEAAPGKVIVDGTLGGGGHTQLMLEIGASVYGIDRDPEARAYATDRLSAHKERFSAIDGNFADVASLLLEQGVDEVDGILVDIGVSSRQFDAAERGFSFSKEGPLDMRMGPSCAYDAADIINHWDEAEISKIFWEYGEERNARRMAKYICEERAQTPFESTIQLADFIEKKFPRRGKKIHPVTKIFQALRITVNDELGALRKLLDTADQILKPGGVLAVISFHSLEDRMVKRHFRDTSQKEIDKREWPAPRPNPEYKYDLLTRKAVEATAEEISRNPRSRSAKLRAAKKVDHE